MREIPNVIGYVSEYYQVPAKKLSAVALISRHRLPHRACLMAYSCSSSIVYALLMETRSTCVSQQIECVALRASAAAVQSFSPVQEACKLSKMRKKTMTIMYLTSEHVKMMFDR